MTDFSNILNGLSADDRKSLIDSAEQFLTSRGSYETCLFCGESITDLVCDAVIGFEWTETGKCNGEEYRAIGRESKMFTCDLPVCSGCRTLGNPIFMCGRKSDVFVPDLCPLHSKAPSLGSEAGRIPVLTEEKVTAWRARAMMMIRSGLIRKADPYPQAGPV